MDECYTIEIPRRLAELLRGRGLDPEVYVVDLLIEKLKIDPDAEAALRVEVAERFLEEARKYIEAGDAVQASEKLYKVAEECIKALAVKFRVPEVEEARREGRWWTKLLARASKTLSAVLNDPMIRYAWKDAYDLYVWGFHEVAYSIDHVGLSIPTIEQLLARTKELVKR